MNKKVIGGGILLLLAAIGIIGLTPDNDVQSNGLTTTTTIMEVEPEYTATTTFVGTAYLFDSGRVMYIAGGPVNDTMILYGLNSYPSDNLITIDCSNGTGDGCVLILKKQVKQMKQIYIKWRND